MKDQIVPVVPGVELKLSYPDDLPSQALSYLIPQVVKSATDIVVKSGGKMIEAAVKGYEATCATVVFYQERGRVLRVEVLPTVAKALAFQTGRNMLRNGGLDDDILADALEELDEKRRKRKA